MTLIFILVHSIVFMIEQKYKVIMIVIINHFKNSIEKLLCVFCFLYSNFTTFVAAQQPIFRGVSVGRV